MLPASALLPHLDEPGDIPQVRDHDVDKGEPPDISPLIHDRSDDRE